MNQSEATSARRRPPRIQPTAYPVPWQVDRGRAPDYRILNIGTEALWGVTLNLSGAAVMRASAPRQVLPGEGIAVTIRAHEIERDTILVLRWFRPSGEEYLWRISF